MKKRTFFFAILISFNTIPAVDAQTSAGRMLIGLSSELNFATGSDLMTLGFSSMKFKSKASGYTEPDPDKSTVLRFIPKFGFFIVDNLAAGLDVALAYMHDKDGESGNKSSETILAAGPFLRYYIPAKKFLPFVEGSVTFGSSKSKYEFEGGSNESKDALFSFGGGIGVAAPLGEKVTLDVMACYTSLTIKAKEDNPDDERMVNGAFGIKLGFIVFLGRAK